MSETRQRVARATAILLTASGLAVLPACEPQDVASDAIRAAQVKLTAITNSGASTARQESKQAVLRQIASDLGAVMGKATGAEKAAANLILSRVHAGLAEASADEAQTFDREYQTDLTRARGLFSTWHSAASNAANLASYDPSTELAAIKAQGDALVAILKTKEAEKASIESQVNDLRAQAKAKADAVNVKRLEAATTRARAATLSPLEAESVVKEAAQRSREGDALEVEQAELETKANQLAPRIAEIQTEIDTLHRQQTLNVKAGEQVSAKAEQASKDSAAETERAGGLATQFDALVTQLLKQRQETVAPKFAVAIESYEKAASAARSGQEVSRSQAGGAGAQASMAIGDLHWANASGVENTISLLERAGSSKPDLASSSVYKTSAEKLQGERDAALEAAAKAYADAMEALEKVAAKSPENTRQLAHAKQRLAEARYKLSGGKDDVRDATREAAGENALNAGNAGAPSGRPSSGAPVEAGGGSMAGGDQGTPEGLLAMLLAASEAKDTKASLRLTHFENESFKRMSSTLVEKLDALDQAMKAKFNASFFDVAAKNPMTKQFASGADVFESGGEKLQATEFKVTTTGDKASAAHPKAPKPVPFIKVGGEWFVDGDAAMGQSMPPGAEKMVERMMSGVANGIDAVIADINSGKITNADNAMGALLQKMMASMAPPPGGG